MVFVHGRSKSGSRRDDPADLAGAVRETIHPVTEVLGGVGSKAALNLAVTDGTSMTLTRCPTDGPGASLRVLEDGETPPGAVVAASDRHLRSVCHESGVTLGPL